MNDADEMALAVNMLLIPEADRCEQCGGDGIEVDSSARHHAQLNGLGGFKGYVRNCFACNGTGRRPMLHPFPERADKECPRCGVTYGKLNVRDRRTEPDAKEQADCKPAESRLESAFLPNEIPDAVERLRKKTTLYAAEPVEMPSTGRIFSVDELPD
jgi:hypothetical protein